VSEAELQNIYMCRILDFRIWFASDLAELQQLQYSQYSQEDYSTGYNIIHVQSSIRHYLSKKNGKLKIAFFCEPNFRSSPTKSHLMALYNYHFLFCLFIWSILMVRIIIGASNFNIRFFCRLRFYQDLIDRWVLLCRQWWRGRGAAWAPHSTVNHMDTPSHAIHDAASARKLNKTW